MATALAPPPSSRTTGLLPAVSSPADCPAFDQRWDLTVGHLVEGCDREPGCGAPLEGTFAGDPEGSIGIDGRVRMLVRMPDGQPYPGDLLDDILEYRQLRTLQLNHERDFDESRLFDLENRLRAVPREDGGLNIRAYHRFDVSMRAKLRHQKVGQVELCDVMTVNVSAGGVKLMIDQIPPEGDRVWLMLPRSDAMVILPARVAWSRGGAVGLMFAGAPTTRPLKGKRVR